MIRPFWHLQTFGRLEVRTYVVSVNDEGDTISPIAPASAMIAVGIWREMRGFAKRPSLIPFS